MKRKQLPPAPHGNRRPTITYLIAESLRKRVADGAVQADLAEEFGVHASEICQIVSRKRFGRDLERESVWLQMCNADRIYEEACKRSREFEELRKKEQEEIDQRASLLQRVAVNPRAGESSFTVSLTNSEDPNVHLSSEEK
jgi:hypothetical protein